MMNLSRKFAVVAVALVLLAGCNAKAKEETKKADDAAAKPVAAATTTAPAAATTATPAAKPAEPNAPAMTDAEKMAKVSYAIGFFNGSSFKRDSIDVKVSDFVKGMTDGMTGATPTMTEDEMRSLLMAFGQELRVKMMEKAKVQGEENKKKGDEFLAANAKKEGVKTTASGLQYKVITEGTGAMPKATDTVKVNYKGTTIDGKEFDSSYKRNEPTEFPVNGVIPGWTEAMQLMKVGSKWQLFIPASLAYGENAPAQIGPNQVLIFEVELLDIVKPEAGAAAMTPSVEIKPAETKPAEAPKK
jgi:FKBP-type peptidyl-prolyl cis-trans isomerase FklB